MPWAGIALTLIGTLVGIILSAIYAAITDYLHNVHVRLDGMQSSIRGVKTLCEGLQSDSTTSQDLLHARLDTIEKIVTPVPVPDVTTASVPTELDNRNV